MSMLPLIRMTLAERLRQPVTWLVTGVSLALLGLSFLFGQFNFEDQDRLRMLATSGVAVAVLNGMFLAVIGASQTVHDELSSRTALTLFAKPLGRGEFLVGKALAVWWSAVLSGLVIAAAHAGLLAWALHYGFEVGNGHHHDHGGSETLWLSWSAVLSAHLLAMMQSALFSSVATVLALRLPLVANILCCFAIFVAGHVIANVGAMGFGPLPALVLFQIDDVIQFSDHHLSGRYLGLTGLYTALACAGWLLSGLALFRRQDIA